MDNERVIKDFLTLIKVEPLHTMAIAKILQIQYEFKEAIETHFLQKINIVPFPQGDSREYVFKIYYAPGTMQQKWEATIEGKHGNLPWESLLPFKLVKKICSYPVNCDEIVHLDSLIHDCNRFNIHFIKYLENGIVGIIQRIKIKTELFNQNGVSIFNVDQYLKMKEDEQLDILNKCLKKYPEARKSILFHFFTHVMPSVIPIKDIT